MAKLFANRFDLDQLPDPKKPKKDIEQGGTIINTYTSGDSLITNPNIRVEQVEPTSVETQAVNAQLYRIDTQKSTFASQEEVLERQGAVKSAANQFVSFVKVDEFGTNPVSQGSTTVSKEQRVQTQVSDVVVKQPKQDVLTVPDTAIEKINQGDRITDPKTSVQKVDVGSKTTNPETPVKLVDVGDKITDPQTAIRVVTPGDRITDPKTLIQKVTIGDRIFNPKIEIQKPQEIDITNQIVQYKGIGVTELFPRTISLKDRFSQSNLGTTKHLPEFIVSDVGTGYIKVKRPADVEKASETVVRKYDNDQIVFEQGAVRTAYNDVISVVVIDKNYKDKTFLVIPDTIIEKIIPGDRIIDPQTKVRKVVANELIVDPKIQIKLVDVGSQIVNPNIKVVQVKPGELIVNPDIQINEIEPGDRIVNPNIDTTPITQGDRITNPDIKVSIPVVGDRTVNPNIDVELAVDGELTTNPNTEIQPVVAGELTVNPNIKVQPAVPGELTTDPKTKISPVKPGERTIDPKTKILVVKPGERTIDPKTVIVPVVPGERTVDPNTAVQVVDQGEQVVDPETQVGPKVPDPLSVFPSTSPTQEPQQLIYDPYNVFPSYGVQPVPLDKELVHNFPSIELFGNTTTAATNQYPSNREGDQSIQPEFKNIVNNEYSSEVRYIQEGGTSLTTTSPLKTAGENNLTYTDEVLGNGGYYERQVTIQPPDAQKGDPSLPGGYRVLNYQQIQKRASEKPSVFSKEGDFRVELGLNSNPIDGWTTRIGMPINGLDTLNTSVNATQNDFVKLKFESVRDSKVLQFRSYITTFNDNFAPQYTDINYIGRPDTLKLFKGTQRTISLAFKVPIFSGGDEIGVVYKKLEELIKIGTLGKNVVGQVYMDGPFIRLTIGSWLKNTPVVLTSLKYDTNPTEYTWDISKEVPQVVDVSLDCFVLSSNNGVSMVTNGNYIGAAL